MKTNIVLVAILLCLANSTLNSQVIDSTNQKNLVKNVNLQFSRAKTGFLMSGFAIVFGSILNLSAINKKAPNPYDYTDPKLLEKDIESYNDNQKSLKTASTVLIGGGGIGLLITGISISRISMNKANEKKVSLSASPFGFDLAYKF